jgi:hypothetical protein
MLRKLINPLDEKRKSTSKNFSTTIEQILNEMGFAGSDNWQHGLLKAKAFKEKKMLTTIQGTI